MLRPRYVFLAAWAIAVLVLWLTVGRKAPSRPDEWTAIRPLPRNAQIREIDFRGPRERYRQARMVKKTELTGRYLNAAKQPGDTIRPDDTAPEPSLEACEAGSGILVYSLKGEESLADALEIGSWVIACYVRPGSAATAPHSTKCAKTSVEVEVVHRSTGPSDSSWVGLRVPPCRIQDVGEYVARDKHFLLVAAAAPPLQDRACPVK